LLPGLKGRTGICSRSFTYTRSLTSGAAARKNRGHTEFGLLLRAIFAMSNIEGALAKNQTAITASVMAHPAEEFERNGIIGAP
jgi:hypothetical protein